MNVAEESRTFAQDLGDEQCRFDLRFLALRTQQPCTLEQAQELCREVEEVNEHSRKSQG